MEGTFPTVVLHINIIFFVFGGRQCRVYFIWHKIFTGSYRGIVPVQARSHWVPRSFSTFYIFSGLTWQLYPAMKGPESRRSGNPAWGRFL